MLNVRYLGSVKGLCPMATVVWILGQKGLESSYRCEGPAYVEDSSEARENDGLTQGE